MPEGSDKKIMAVFSNRPFRFEKVLCGLRLPREIDEVTSVADLTGATLRFNLVEVSHERPATSNQQPATTVVSNERDC